MEQAEPIEVYLSLEKALVTLKHEGHPPWFDLFYLLHHRHKIGKKVSTIQFDGRRRYAQGQFMIWKRALFDRTSGLPAEWSDHQIANEKGLRAIYDQLRHIDLFAPDIDPFAMAYNLLIPFDERVGRGVFFTPPNVARFIAKVLCPTENDRVIDPACGTGVLLEAMKRKLLEIHSGELESLGRNERRLRQERVLSNIDGMEIDPLLCAISIRLFIHWGPEIEQVMYQDALDRRFDRPLEGSYDIVVANPPFGVRVKEDYVTDYELGSLPIIGSKSEVLFIERCINLARPKYGRLALILSEEVFENPAYGPVLDYIQQRTTLVAEFKLPRTTFSLSGTDVKTRLLFLRRNKNGLSQEPLRVEVGSIGITADGKREPSDLLKYDLQMPSLDASRPSLTELADMVHQRTTQGYTLADWGSIHPKLTKLTELYKKLVTRTKKSSYSSGLHNDVPMSTPGAIRDFIIELLNLRLFNGLDGDLLDLFSPLRAEHPEDLQRHVRDKTLTMLMKQVRKGNTFFLDVSKMRDIPELGELVATILDVRNKQVLRLEENPPLVDVYSSYYGFTILTQGSIQQDAGGVSSEAMHRFGELARQLGKDISIGHTKLRYSSRAFGRVSKYTRKLLWNMLLVSAGGINSRLKALKELGQMRDSRALQVLHPQFRHTENKDLKDRILSCVDRIGHRSSIEVLREELKAIERDPFGYRIRDVAKRIEGTQKDIWV